MPNFAREGNILRNVRVPMRDGVTLATSLFLPEGDGPWPVVLVRTAYNRVPMGGAEFTRRKIAFAVQDVRGRYDSGGDWYPFLHEQDDGEDTLDWLSLQPWCNGRVGMFGASYLAATQFYAALTQHPALCALNPQFMAGDPWKRAYYCAGALSLGLTWSWLCFECSARTSEAAWMPLFDVAAVLRSLPLIDMDVASGAGEVPWYRDYVRNARYGPHWEPLNVREQFHRVTVPMLLMGGWYDYYAGETCRNFAALGGAGNGHRMILGPWTHGLNPTSVLGEVDFGPAALAANGLPAQWLETLLLGGSPDDVQPAPVRIFVMGLNQWRDEWEWPLARAQDTEWYLRAGGGLSLSPPGDEPPDSYLYDPADPAPTHGGNHSIGPYNPGLYEMAPPGPFDQRETEARPDVLTFTSDPLPLDMEVTGPVSLVLHAATDGADTDFVARLCDVFPDGRSVNLTEGVLRCRFRNGVWAEPALLEPGRVYLFEIDLDVTSNLFRAGHRLRLDITSSNFPLWDRNLNTGGDPATDTELRVARQTILHDHARPSHLRLPVVAR